MTLQPDTKDWTWVLTRPCEECGVDTGTIAVADVAPTIRAAAARWDGVLGRDAVRQRPRADVWSPLEYAAHVRDVFRLFDARVTMMLLQVDPLFGNWDQDETAERGRYGEQDPAVVRRQLAEAAEHIAPMFDDVQGEDWQRTGRRSDGAVFTIESFARYLLHDVLHHLHDVRA